MSDAGEGQVHDGSYFGSGALVEGMSTICLSRRCCSCRVYQYRLLLQHDGPKADYIQYKGHLSNISENTLMTAVNDEGGQINVAVERDGSEDTIPKTMQKYKARNEPWMLVVDDNCGSFILVSLADTLGPVIGISGIPSTFD